MKACNLPYTNICVHVHYVHMSHSHTNTNKQVCACTYIHIPCVGTIISFRAGRTKLLKANREAPRRTDVVGSRGCQIWTALSRWTWRTAKSSSITESTYKNVHDMYKYTNTCTCTCTFTMTMCMPRCECISYGNNVPGTQGNGNCSAEGHSDPAGHVVHVVDPFIL